MQEGEASSANNDAESDKSVVVYDGEYDPRIAGKLDDGDRVLFDPGHTKELDDDLLEAGEAIVVQDNLQQKHEFIGHLPEMLQVAKADARKFFNLVKVIGVQVNHMLLSGEIGVLEIFEDDPEQQEIWEGKLRNKLEFVLIQLDALASFLESDELKEAMRAYSDNEDIGTVHQILLKNFQNLKRDIEAANAILSADE